MTPVFGIGRARGADADAGEAGPCIRVGGKDRFDGGLHGSESFGGGAVRGHWYAGVKKDFAFDVDEAGGDFGAADVDAEGEWDGCGHFEA